MRGSKVGLYPFHVFLTENEMRRCLNILLLSLPFAALAASNPEVVLPECDQRTVAESCGGVTPPVPGEVFAVAGCTNFAFRIEDPLPGRERIDRREVWYGGANCPESKDLEPRYRDLTPEISWSVVSGGVTNRGAGAVVSVPRADGVCRASCTFELTVSPSLCPPPAPVTVTAEAVFADAVSLRERETTRLCCLSSDHAPHLFDLDGCDAPVLSVVPADAATVVSLDGRTAHVKGLRPFEDAQAVATAACGAATNLFDVVGLGDFAVTGLCGCRSASDATDSDSDAPTAETMDLGADATGFSLVLGVEPVRWAGDARWRVTGPDGWMPNAGSFADDGQRTFAVCPEAFPAVLDAWFDWEDKGQNLLIH